MNAEPVILEVALNGVTSPARNPAVPTEPAAIAKDALACFAAGASIVHTHNDDTSLPPEQAAERYHAAYRPIVDERPDAILYPTIGGGEAIELRYGHHDGLAEAGVIRMGLVDPGSTNLGAVGPDGDPLPFEFVYANPPSHIRHMVETCRRYGLGPSIAIFEPGWLRAVLAYHRAGRLPTGALVKLYFSGGGGYFGEGTPLFSPPPIREALDLYLAMFGESGLPWAVALLGGSLLDSPIAELALERGGHLRVGLEDNLAAASNVAEVERARELCTRMGRPLARVADTERILRLPARRHGGLT